MAEAQTGRLPGPLAPEHGSGYDVEYDAERSSLWAPGTSVQPHGASGTPRLRALAAPSHPRVVLTAKLAPLTVLMALFVDRFATASVDMLRAFQQDAYDLALYDQGIWLLSRFRAPFMTVMGTDMFAAHTSFIFTLLVPLDWAYPHTAALLVLQAVALAAGAVPVYLLAQRLLANRALATMLAAAYLFNPAVQQATLDQFHVEAFEAPLLAFALYAAVTWKPRLLVAMVVAVLLCKQDTALFVVPIGAWVWCRRDAKVGLAIAASAAAFGVVENLLVVPALLNGLPASYSGWWPYGSLSATLDVMVRKPGEMWHYLVSAGRPFYLWQMGFSAGFAFLASPGVLAVALPELAADAFSSNPYLHQIFRHYSVPTAAVLLCATVCGVARLSGARRTAATAVATLCALWGCTLWGDAPFSDNAFRPPNPSSPAVVATARLMREIPPGAVVSVAQNYVPNLDHRVKIYMFPTPFYQSYYGDPRYNGKRLPFASSVQYLLLPRCLSCSGTMGPAAPAVLRQIAPEFRVVGRGGGAVLYERAGPG